MDFWPHRSAKDERREPDVEVGRERRDPQATWEAITLLPVANAALSNAHTTGKLPLRKAFLLSCRPNQLSDFGGGQECHR